MLFAALAYATSTYPAGIGADLATPCTAPCTICHATATGGAGTVNQPFGIAMQDRGLVGGGDTAALSAALTQMTADAVDSNNDGTPDTASLTLGLDPNTGAAFCNAGVLPEYGCFGTGTTAVAGLLILPGLLWRRNSPRGVR